MEKGRLTDVDQNTLVARQLITTAALFETRAVYVELEQELNLAILAARENPKALDSFQKRQQRQLYAPQLLLYSAPAHFAATHCTDGDIIEAYKIAA